MADWTRLPHELWRYILSLLADKDLGNARRSCSVVNASVTSFDSSFWNDRIRRRLPAAQRRVKLSAADRPYKIYSKIISKYAHLLGVWRMALPPYGAFIHVEFDGSDIVAFRLDCPFKISNISQNLRPVCLFSIALSQDDAVTTTCPLLSGCNEEHHKCRVELVDNLEFRYFGPDGLRQIPSNASILSEVVADLSTLQPEERDQAVFYIRRMKHILEYECNFSAYKILHQPVTSLPVPIKPGLFKGSYSAHGIELVQLTYKEAKVEIVKITGDANIPSSKVTIRSNLDSPVLVLPQHETLSDLRDVRPVTVPFQQLQPQQFSVPPGCHAECSNFFPTTCIARFCSQGQIAHSGYQNPSFIKGHWIVFDENSFAHLWFDLYSISYFCRIQEEVI